MNPIRPMNLVGRCVVLVFASLCVSVCLGQTVELSAPVAKTQVRSSADSGKATVKALLITGGCCHDYQNQKQIISESLSERFGNIDWTIIEYGDKKDIKADVYRSGDWIDGFDIVVHNECFGGVTDGDFVKGIVAAHRRTKIPAIVVHCSMHSYRNAPTADVWREFLGVTSRRHEKTKHSLKVVPTDAGKDHPILEVLDGKAWDTPNGELYIIEQVWPGTTVLATAHSDETHKDEPVIWTNETQGVKVFGISLGHHNETMMAEPWQAITAAGWTWAMQ